MKPQRVAAVLFSLIALTSLASTLAAFPGGTPRLVTNMNPQCANCHSSVDANQLRDQSPEAAGSMTIEKRHYAQLESGAERYAKISAEDRAKLLDAVKAVDANSSVTLAASAAKVKPSGTLTLTVTTKGGAGPVVGVMLTDSDLRFGASPVQAAGFWISAEPAVTGPDGKPQTTFLDGRAKELGRNINYVNVTGVQSDVDSKSYPTCKVSYMLVAPSKPGTYSISAAFLYGTEKATAVGRVEGMGGAWDLPAAMVVVQVASSSQSRSRSSSARSSTGTREPGSPRASPALCVRARGSLEPHAPRGAQVPTDGLAEIVEWAKCTTRDVRSGSADAIIDARERRPPRRATVQRPCSGVSWNCSSLRNA